MKKSSPEESALLNYVYTREGIHPGDEMSALQNQSNIFTLDVKVCLLRGKNKPVLAHGM